MAKLMEEVLLLGRADSGKMEFKPAPLDLAAFCGRIISQVQSATSGRCPIQFRPGLLSPACGDEALLHPMLTNLLTNAVKYSPEGSPVEFTLEQHGDEAIFRIKDSGIGIPAADQKQLFTAFYRGRNATHLPGSGLGLVIVKRCVELHRGQVACESAEGKGTTFTVRLRLFDSAAEQRMSA
jgi:signal transduction histidine kinase